MDFSLKPSMLVMSSALPAMAIDEIPGRMQLLPLQLLLPLQVVITIIKPTTQPPVAQRLHQGRTTHT